MVKPLKFSTFNDSQSWSGERGSLLVEGSRLFPPFQKLLSYFNRTESQQIQNYKRTERQSSPSLVQTFPGTRRSFKALKSGKQKSSFAEDISPVDLSSCSYSYSPGVMAAGLRQRYWPPMHLSTTNSNKRFNYNFVFCLKILLLITC